MYKALYISPMVPSYDVGKTSEFFQNLFDFKVVINDKDYAVLYKDNLTIHLLSAGSNIGEMEFYLQVDNIDLLWNIIKDKLEKIQFKAPFNRDYGMREIHIAVPYSKTLMFVGQRLS